MSHDVQTRLAILEARYAALYDVALMSARVAVIAIATSVVDADPDEIKRVWDALKAASERMERTNEELRS